MPMWLYVQKHSPTGAILTEQGHFEHELAGVPGVCVPDEPITKVKFVDKMGATFKEKIGGGSKDPDAKGWEGELSDKLSAAADGDFGFMSKAPTDHIDTLLGELEESPESKKKTSVAILVQRGKHTHLLAILVQRPLESAKMLNFFF